MIKLPFYFYRVCVNLIAYDFEYFSSVQLWEIKQEQEMYTWLRVRKCIYIGHLKTPGWNYVACLFYVSMKLDSDAYILPMWLMVTIQLKCTSWPPQGNVSSAFDVSLNAARTICQGR